MNKHTFISIAQKTIANLPEEFRSQLENVEIVIDESTEDISLLGLYSGVPKTEREHYSSLPDKITLYKKALESSANSDTALEEQIQKTVMHEIGHHFGMTDEDLDRVERK